jgi:hypothetical protein
VAGWAAGTSVTTAASKQAVSANPEPLRVGG